MVNNEGVEVSFCHAAVTAVYSKEGSLVGFNTVLVATGLAGRETYDQIRHRAIRALTGVAASLGQWAAALVG